MDWGLGPFTKYPGNPILAPTQEGWSISMGADQLAPLSVLRIAYAFACVALQVRTSVNTAPSSFAPPRRKRSSAPSSVSTSGP